MKNGVFFADQPLMAVAVPIVLQKTICMVLVVINVDGVVLLQQDQVAHVALTKITRDKNF